MSKLRVAFHEFNIRMGQDYCYLPIVSGILRAYAGAEPEIRDNCEFLPYLYVVDSPANAWGRYPAPPDVAAFSVSMWNEQLCFAMARRLKQTYGDKVLIVFGGYSVPNHPAEYMEKHPFIDLCVRSEGEESFKAILKERLGNCNYRDIPGVTRRSGDVILENKQDWPFQKDLDCYPSPYLTGAFDDLMSAETGVKWQAIIETNRGCNWPCSFCAWGRGGTTTRFRFHSMDRVRAEIDWCGRNKIPYLFNADSNFAQHPRDLEIAQYLVETKARYGFPDKFRTCFGKNADEKIFKAATLLHSAGMEKGITLARQSNDPTTLENIRRQNISLAAYRSLQERFNDNDIPVYVELILGLPGETLESWEKGIDDCLTKAGSKNSLFVYMCQVLPNTEMADFEYQKKHGIRTRKVELQEIHGSVRDPGWVTEFEELIIATNSLPYDRWRLAAKFSWATMTLHSMKAGFFVLAWLWDRYKIPPSELIRYLTGDASWVGKLPTFLVEEWRRWNALLDEVSVFGKGRGQILPEYGNIYWDVEEAAILRILENAEEFYGPFGFLRNAVERVLNEHEIGIDWPELYDILRYQYLRMPRFGWREKYNTGTVTNVAEYFDKLFSRSPVPLVKKPQNLTFTPREFASKEQFARETILWGRKSGTMLVPCAYEDVA